VVATTLARLGADAAVQGLAGPALILVGETVRLGDASLPARAASAAQ
jgi:siroheme synthase